MKIEVNERGKREFYDEILFIASKHNKISNNPNMKVQVLSLSVLKYLMLLIIVLIIYIVFYIIFNDTLYLYLLGVITCAAIITSTYLYKIKKRINNFINEKGTKEIIINEKSIEFKDNKKELKSNWDDIMYIIINKYSICFLPKTINSLMISIQIDYKDKIIDGIKKYKKESLIIDNSDKY